MQFGAHLHELWRLRLGLILSLALAALVALSAAYRISVLPPGLEPRAMEIGTASTHVMIDTPRSTILDLRQPTDDLESLTNRAVLLGNVMAGLPVRRYIARRAGVAPERIDATSPVTPAFPRPVSAPGESKHATDLLRSTDQYRLSIQANPTVPFLDLYAQAPTAAAAERLANAAVDGLRDYLADVARTQGTPATQEVRLSQLGRAHGGVINAGVRPQVLLLVFVLVLAVSCAAVLFGARVRRGWELGPPEDGHAAGAGAPS
jgi:hypothetical protein